MMRMAGPFIIVPGLVCVVTMSVMAYPAFIERPWVLILIMLTSFSVPLALEAAHVVPMTWELRDGGLVSHAQALELSGTPSHVLILGATLATFVVAGINAARIARTNRVAQRQLVTQAWHLRQLLPK
jgi:hypothetical protein